MDFDEDLTEEEMFKRMFDKKMSKPEMKNLLKIKSELIAIIRLIMRCKRLVSDFSLI